MLGDKFSNIFITLIFFLNIEYAYSESPMDDLYMDMKNIHNDFADPVIISSESNVDELLDKSSSISNRFKSFPPGEVLKYKDGCDLANLFFSFSYQYFLIENHLICEDGLCLFDDKNKTKYDKSLELYGEEITACER